MTSLKNSTGWGLCVAWAFLALMLGVSPVSAHELTASADGAGLWVLIPEPDQPDTFTVLHHAYVDPPTQLNKVLTLRGGIHPYSVTSLDHTLWIIYPHGEVQSIRAKRSILQDGWEYHNQVEPSLPDGVSIRATAKTRAGLWVLASVDDRRVLEGLDASGIQARGERGERGGASAKRRRNIALGLPPGYGIDEQADDAQSAEQKESAEDKTAEDDGQSAIDTPDTTPVSATDPAVPSLPVDRLLVLEHGRWRVHTLPEDWSHGSWAWLVVDNKTAKLPTVVVRDARQGAQGPIGINVYRHNQQEPASWGHTLYTLDGAADTPILAFVGVEDQLAVAQCRFDAGQVTADLSVLRGGKVMNAGRMSLSEVTANQWALLGSGNAAALLARQPAPQGVQDDTVVHLKSAWTRMDVRGQIVLEPTGLAVKTRSAMDELTQYAMLAFVAVLVTAMMLAFWRRDASWNKLDLPEDSMVADLGRRAIAAAIDMAPGLAGSMFYFGLSFEELMLRWPGNGIAYTIEQVIPGTIVIAVFVGHTTLSELFFARTLGKLITGLRTTALDGKRPRLWQLLVRGLLKTLDLIPGAWLLLLLPVISPNRQRLGDLVGRTVVVSDAPKAEEAEQNESDQASKD
jgi:uncharacterized RDD family membrane protein YckC